MEEYHIKTLPAQNFITRVYMWMTAALAITASTAFFVFANDNFYKALIGNPVALLGLIAAQLILVTVLSAGLQRLSYPAALTIFLSYSAITGITLAPVIKLYTNASISLAFITAAIMFGTMALYGYFTKADLSGLRSIFTMFIIGLIVSSVVNIFLGSAFFELIISGVGVAIFSGLVAYDMQYLKRLSLSAFEDMQTFNKLTLIGALRLYLDLVNLFLYILRIIGKRRQN